MLLPSSQQFYSFGQQFFIDLVIKAGSDNFTRKYFVFGCSRRKSTGDNDDLIQFFINLKHCSVVLPSN